MGKKHKKKQRKNSPVLASNKKAFFNYTVLEKHTCGIVLQGAEVKAIRMRNVSLLEAYCFFKNEELWIRQMHVGHYSPASYQNADPTRVRKLLLQKAVIRRLQRKKLEKALTIVPLRVLLSEKGLVKVEIGLVQGKKQYDKRIAIKERDQKRRLERKKQRECSNFTA